MNINISIFSHNGKKQNTRKGKLLSTQESTVKMVDVTLTIDVEEGINNDLCDTLLFSCVWMYYFV